MAYDLTKSEDRKKAIGTIVFELQSELEIVGIKFAPNVKFEIQPYAVIVALKEMNPDHDFYGMTAFGSEITIYSTIQSEERQDYDVARILMGSGGPFDPIKDTTSYWRMIHGGALVSNWGDVVRIVDKNCQKFRKLEKEINKANNV